VIQSFAEFRRRSGDRIEIVFSGDMRVGENTPRSANVQAQRSALQQTAAFSTKWLATLLTVQV